jgi:hypothetical protein
MKTPLFLTMIVASPASVMQRISARAQAAVEAEMIGYHEPSDGGDRCACIKVGILIGRNRQRQADWRRTHAEWFCWER